MTIAAGARRNLRGWVPDRPDHRDKMAPTIPPGTVLPPAVDLRPRCPPVRDQGSIGSCTANAGAEAMGFLYTRDGAPDPSFSRLFIYYHSRRDEGVPPGEDSGCMIRDVLRTMARRGACLETHWPYLDDGERYAADPGPERAAEGLEHQILIYLRLPTLRTIKASLAQGFPVVGGFSVPESMLSPDVERTGIVPFPASDEGFVGGHAVLFCGYSDATSSLTFMNSWGPNWGIRGFGTLPIRYVLTGLADDFWTVRREEM